MDRSTKTADEQLAELGLSFDELVRGYATLRAENERLRAELAEWEVENGMNRTFIRQEIGRLRAALSVRKGTRGAR